MLVLNSVDHWPSSDCTNLSVTGNVLVVIAKPIAIAKAYCYY